MKCDFELRERLCEDVRGHFFSRAVLDVDLLVGNGLSAVSDEMVADVNVFGPRVIVVICSEVERSLIVAEEGGWRVDAAEERANESSKPDAYFAT
jgi:hypothetical protein